MFESSAALIVSGAEMIKNLDDKRPFIEFTNLKSTVFLLHPLSQFTFFLV